MSAAGYLTRFRIVKREVRGPAEGDFTIFIPRLGPWIAVAQKV